MDYKKIRISVIIPCYNGEETITDQLDALLSQSSGEPFEIVVADNRSTDNSKEIVLAYSKKIPFIKLVDASKKKGAAFARNRGGDAASGELFLFCDADDIVALNWIEEMIKALGSHDIVASRFEHSRLNSEYIATKKSGMQSSELLVSRDFKPSYPYAGASGLGVRKKVHTEIGGFDEKFLASEDWDYCWQAQLKGYELYFEPNAVVHIRHPDDAKNSLSQAVFWGEYFPLIAKKYLPYGIKPDNKKALRDWKILISNFPKLLDGESRNTILVKLAFKFGRLKGSFKHKVLAL